MGVHNTFIDSGETLTIDFTRDTGSFTNGHGSSAVTYDYMASGVQAMDVSLDALSSGETAVYTVYGKDADGNVVSDSFTVDSTDPQNFIISAADVDDAVYIDRVEFSAGEDSNYQLAFNTITTVDVNENVSMDLGYTVEDADGDFDSAVVTINVTGEDQDGALSYIGTDDELDVYDMGEPGTEVNISNYDITEDVININDVIEDSDSEVTADTLHEYMELSSVDSDADGLVDDTQVLIDSNGESDTGGVLTALNLEDVQLDNTDIDDMKVDYESN
jgi:hypothetical protein